MYNTGITMNNNELADKVKTALNNLNTAKPNRKSGNTITKKSLSRIVMVQLLYQVNFTDTLEISLQYLLKCSPTERESGINSLVESFCRDGLSDGCFNITDFHKAINHNFIVQLLQQYLSNYDVLLTDLQNLLTDNQSFNNLSLVIKNIATLGMAELKYFLDTPAKVIINEYVDIANCFLEKKQVNLINGILDSANKKFRPN